MESQTSEWTRLQEIGARIERWRSTRLKRSAMAPELWEEAINLARMLGVSPVARALRLGHDSLRKRVEQRRSAGGLPAMRPAFIELSGAQLLANYASGEAVLEIQERDGARLTLRLPGASGLDVTGVVHAFRERR